MQQQKNSIPSLKTDIDFLKGWTPVAIDLKSESREVSWLNFGDIGFTDPFFKQTIARFRREFPDFKEITTDLLSLIRLEQISDSLEPNGFIFHASRCGSTLLANALRSLEDSLVVSEAVTIGSLLGKYSPDDEKAFAKDLLRCALLRGLINALGQRRFRTERRFYIKFTSLDLFGLPAIRTIWPDVPVIFLYRDPLEIMVSNLEKRPPWLESDSSRISAEGFLNVAGDELDNLDNQGKEEYCARVIGRQLDIAENYADSRTLFVNYANLKIQNVKRLLSFFSVMPTESELSLINRAFSLYSKDAEGTIHFESDSERKRAAASNAVRDLADKWAMEPYRRLNELQPDWLL